MGDIMPTMRRTVAQMRRWNFVTTDSGDGVTNVEAGMGCAIAFPHVFAAVLPGRMVEAADELRERMNAAGMAGSVEVSYSPDGEMPRHAVIALLGVTDADWPKP